jgi:MoaA/NifB/PqqE/SkfB family radical SAM enzyme
MKMRSANLRLGLKCNENCLFCTVANDKESVMTTGQAKETVSGFARDGIKSLTITGGEPTLRPDLPELVKHARKSGIKRVDLQTNAVRLSDEAYLLTLKRAGLNYITVGFHSHKRETYNHLTQSVFYDSCLSGIRNAVKNNITLAVYHVINRENYKDTIDFIDFVRSISGGIEFAFAFLRPNGNTLKNPQIVPKLTEIETSIHEMLGYLESKGIPALLEGVPLCYMQGFEGRSAETWRMKQPAVRYASDGKTRHENLHEDINRNLKRKSDVCGICRLDGICAGVWMEYADLHGTGELFPVFSEVVV